MAGPLLLELIFAWTCRDVRRPRRRVLKPDNDNAAKTLTDVLVERGWILDDAHASRTIIEKWDVPPHWETRRPGVRVTIQTLPEFEDVPVRDAEPSAFADGLHFFPFPKPGDFHAS